MSAALHGKMAKPDGRRLPPANKNKSPGRHNRGPCVLWESTHHFSTAAASKSLLRLIFAVLLLFTLAPLRWFGPTAAQDGAPLLNPLSLPLLLPLVLLPYMRESFPAHGDELKPCPATLPKRRADAPILESSGSEGTAFEIHHR